LHGLEPDPIILTMPDPTPSRDRRSVDRGPFFLKIAIGLAVLAGAVYGANVWLDYQKLQSQIADVVARAEDLHARQEYSEMAVLVRDALKENPGHWELLFQLGRSDLGNRMPTDATDHLEAAAEDAPADRKAQVYLRLGKAYEMRMKGATNKSRWLNLALSCYDQAMNDEETKARALEDSAMLELASVRQKIAGPDAIRRARDHFQQLLGEHGDDPDVNAADVSDKIKALDGILDRDREQDSD